MTCNRTDCDQVATHGVIIWGQTHCDDVRLKTCAEHAATFEGQPSTDVYEMRKNGL